MLTSSTSIAILLVSWVSAAEPAPADATLDVRGGTPTSGVAAPTATPVFTGGLNSIGMKGPYRLESGFSDDSGTLVLMAGSEFSHSTGLITARDSNTRTRLTLLAAWTPISMLSVGLRYGASANRNTNSTPRTLASFGDPGITVKVALPVGDLGVGARLDVAIPTATMAPGLSVGALTIQGDLLASYPVLPWLVATANLGYRYDRSASLESQDNDAADRFAAGISSADLIAAGIGVEASLPVSANLALGPFVELTSGVPVGASMKESPTRLTLGTKVVPTGLTTLAFLAGADVAISGKPRAGGELAGIPPWELFLRVGGQVGGAAAPAQRPVEGCVKDDECAAGRSCIEGACTLVKEVVKVVEKEVARPVDSPTANFLLSGGVFDATSGDPISGATLVLMGYEDIVLATAPKTGAFKSWPLPAGDGLIKITAQAPGYRPSDQTVPRGKPGEIVDVVFKMTSITGIVMGEMKGVIRDAATGTPVKGATVFIPILNKRFRTDEDGRFAAQCKAGNYQVLISAKTFVTQKKAVTIRAGDVVIFNVDMSKK